MENGKSHLKIPTIVIGAGQAGLSMSYYLKQNGINHRVLEKGQVGDSWITQRWDSFHLVTQNWQNQLPGLPYSEENPEEFSSKTQVINYLQNYQKKFQLPVCPSTEVLRMSQKEKELFEIETQEHIYTCRSVIVASGSLNYAWIPDSLRNMSQDILQIHSSEYRNPDLLPQGAVLIVGGGQSGVQIASEIRKTGRDTYLSVGRTTWIPRTYRGKDILNWITALGITEIPIHHFPQGEKMRFGLSPVISPQEGGLRDCQRLGIILLGSINKALGYQVHFESDLSNNLAEADLFCIQVTRLIDSYIKKNGIHAPEEKIKTQLTSFMPHNSPHELNLEKSKIKTVIWATGFRPNFSWIDIPLFNEQGYPIANRGITSVPGLYFLGLHWLHTLKSGSLYGVKQDSEYLIGALLKRIHS